VREKQHYYRYKWLTLDRERGEETPLVQEVPLPTPKKATIEKIRK
jgi:hypothetical protein